MKEKEKENKDRESSKRLVNKIFLKNQTALIKGKCNIGQNFHKEIGKFSGLVWNSENM